MQHGHRIQQPGTAILEKQRCSPRCQRKNSKNKSTSSGGAGPKTHRPRPWTGPGMGCPESARWHLLNGETQQAAELRSCNFLSFTSFAREPDRQRATESLRFLALRATRSEDMHIMMFRRLCSSSTAASSICRAFTLCARGLMVRYLR